MTINFVLSCSLKTGLTCQKEMSIVAGKQTKKAKPSAHLSKNLYSLNRKGKKKVYKKQSLYKKWNKFVVDERGII